MILNTAHSLAPWKVRYLKNNDPEFGFFVQAPRNKKSESYDIEVLGEDEGNGMYPMRQRLADAKLIAASPELLDGLNQASEIIEALIAGKPVKNLDESLAYFKSTLIKATK